MAECSYARCLQERHIIKRDLMRWSKNMMHIVGLERVAEEFMGRRKWKLCQEALTRSHIISNTTYSNQSELQNLIKDQKPDKGNPISSKEFLDDEFAIENGEPIIKQELVDSDADVKDDSIHIKREYLDEDEPSEDTKPNQTSQSAKENGEAISSYPIDWNPDDKCYFCVDGKLLTVNEKGDLVAESGPALAEAELAHRKSLDTDSDSSDSSPDTGGHLNKALTSRIRDSHPPNMTSLESMAAHLAAIQSIQGLQSGLGQLYPNIWYHQLTQQHSDTPTTSETSAAAISPPLKDSPSPSDATGEQPLDLSSKPSPNSSIGGDSKPVFRAKPRMTAVTGRRTYSEEELNNALQAIMSGKLGTRRAAVLYKIPRSTLRNKVYKIAMEQKRDTTSSMPQASLDDLDGDDDDKELSGDDESNDKQLSPLNDDDVAEQYTTSHLQKITKSGVNHHHQHHHQPTTSLDSLAKTKPSTPHRHSHTPPTAATASAAAANSFWLEPHVIMQSLLLSGRLGGVPNLLQPKADDPAMLGELFNAILLKHQEEQANNSAEAAAAMNNGKPNMIDPRILMQQLQQHQQHTHAGHSYPSRLPKSETPETASSVDMNESCDDPSVILKIPSFKPVAGGGGGPSTSSSKNGGDGSKIPASLLAAAVSSQQSQPNNMPGISPSLLRPPSESQTPPMYCFREVIADSIARTYNQQAGGGKDAASPIEPNDQYKKPSISVIKNIGGTDISRFATAPNMLGGGGGGGANSMRAHHQDAANNAAGGGKGTRPKRGKYRNYDRDSLVEAVKAVQRGEMSVHRAGSYYGVPHSTLEYKVKERHLMRPRKREPKVPLEERLAGGSSAVSGNSGANSSVNSKNSNIPGLTAVNSLDKLKASAAAAAAAKSSNSKGGANPPFPTTSPNGLKMPIFDPAIAAQLQYSQQLFWQHSSGLGALPMDFQRTAAGTSSGGGAANSSSSSSTAAAGYPGAAESFIQSQMMQRFHEETNRLNSANANAAAVASPKPNAKNARNLAETLYDSGEANGSFLDGIIRKTLDMPHGALRDQLAKGSKPLGGLLNNSKRPASPYPAIDIKRERASPHTDASASDSERASHDRDGGESVKSNNDRDSSLLLHPHTQHHHHQHQHRRSVEDHNGGNGNGNGNSIGMVASSILHEKLGQIKSETEDSL